jgi:Bacterial Ig-like domain (group 3)
VKAVAPGAGTPAGTVTFREGETVLAIVPLSGSAATYPLKSLPVGEHKITAAYNGSADYDTSDSSIAQVITG